MLNRAKSLVLNAALAVALLVGAVAVAAETGMIVTERPAQSSPAELKRAAPRIVVRGKVNGLYPGAVKSMRVRVRNGFPQRVQLVWVRARVKNANAGCSKRNIRVKRFRGKKPIPANSTTRVFVKTRMSATAPDACQGARFPIRFKARVIGQGR